MQGTFCISIQKLKQEDNFQKRQRYHWVTNSSLKKSLKINDVICHEEDLAASIKNKQFTVNSQTESLSSV